MTRTMRLACGVLSYLCLAAVALAQPQSPPGQPAYPAPAQPAPAPYPYRYPAPYPPPYGPYPPPYAYPAPPPQPPRELPYHEGNPIPQGYYLDEGIRRGPVIAGSIVLAVPYAIGISVASSVDFDDSTGWLMLPVLGPWLTLATRDNTCEPETDFACDDDRAIRTLLVMDGLMQGTGAALLIWGIASPRKRLLRQDVMWGVGPRRVGSGFGLGAAGRF